MAFEGNMGLTSQPVSHIFVRETRVFDSHPVFDTQ
jgi:hypothetical protein